jgi:hypothetical protein
MCCSALVTGGVHCVTGGVPIGSLGLFTRYAAIIKSLIGVIGRFRGKEKMCHLRLSIGSVVRNDRTSRHRKARLRESSHVWMRTSSRLCLTR